MDISENEALIEPSSTVREPETTNEPVNECKSSVLSPNLVEPLSKIVVDWDTSVTNFSAVKIPPTVKLPVIL